MKGLSCRFRTAWDAQYPAPFPSTPCASSRPPRSRLRRWFLPAAAWVLSISLRAAGAGFDWRSLPDGSLRLFIDAEASPPRRCVIACSCAASGRTWSETTPSGGSRCRARSSAKQERRIGEALLDFPAIAHPAYRQLTEYFCFPKNSTAGLRPALPRPRSGRCSSSSQRSWSEGGRARSGRPAGCRDVSRINPAFPVTGGQSFRAARRAIRITSTDRLSVVADARNAFGYEVSGSIA